MRACFTAVPAIVWLGMCTATLLAESKPLEYPRPQLMRLEQGYVVLEQPRANAKIVKRVSAPEEVKVGAHLDTSEGRFYLTDWSVARRRAGKSYFWLWVPEAKVGGAAPAAAGDWRKRLVRYTKPRSVAMPQGYAVLPPSAVTEGRGSTVLKHGTPGSSVILAGELRISGATLYLSDWSLERLDKGLGEPNWIVPGADPRAGVVQLNEPPGEPDSPPAWEGELTADEGALLNAYRGEPSPPREVLLSARKLVPRLAARFGANHAATLEIQLDLAFLELQEGNILRGRRLLASALAAGGERFNPLASARAHFALGAFAEADRIFPTLLQAKQERTRLPFDLEVAEVITTRLKLGATQEDAVLRQAVAKAHAMHDQNRAARALIDGGQPALAIRLLSEAVRGADGDHARRRYLLGLAELHLKLREKSAAQPLLDEMCKLLPLAGEEYDGRDAGSMAKLACLLAKSGRGAEAQRYLQKAIEHTTWTIDVDGEHPDLFTGAPAALGLARELELGEEWIAPMAARTVDASRRVAETFFTDEAESGSETTEFYSEEFLTASLPASAGSARWTAEALLQMKGSLLEQRTIRRRLEVACRDGAGRRLLARLQELEAEHRARGFEKRYPSNSGLGSAYDEVYGKLRELLGPGVVPPRAQRVTVEQVCRALPPRTALVEFFTYPRGYAAVVLRPDAAPALVDCAPASAVAIAIEAFRSAADPAPEDARGGAELERALEQSARELYRLIAAPVEKALPAEVEDVILSPAGHLNFLSLPALVAEDGSFWGETRRLHHVGSGRDLLHPAPVLATGASALVIGAPSFLLADGGRRVAAPPRKDDFTGTLIAAVRGGGREVAADLAASFSDLPGTRAELALVRDLLAKAGFAAEVRSSAAATERGLRAAASPAILHLATHGFFFDQLAVGGSGAARLGDTITDPMLLGGIALAGIRNTFAEWSRGRMPPPEDDGFLSAYEAANLKLDGTFLVTLSACETGLGEATGTNGVLGLKRGFLQAGARNLLHTLWKVADQETVELMEGFYTAVVAGQHPSHALVETQRKLLRKWREERGLRAAIHLAGPFVLTSSTAIPPK